MHLNKLKNCSICNASLSMYKCPSCLVNYCSVACYKKHKDIKCEALIKRDFNVVSEEDVNLVDILHKTSDTVPFNKLQNLKCDKHLNDLLTNSHLRDLLMAVDTSTNPDEIIQKAMREPLFVEFADACLKVVEPEEK